MADDTARTFNILATEVLTYPPEEWVMRLASTPLWGTLSKWKQQEIQTYALLGEAK